MRGSVAVPPAASARSITTATSGTMNISMTPSGDGVVTTVTGLPTGVSLNAGEPLASGAWALDTADFESLSLTTPCCCSRLAAMAER